MMLTAEQTRFVNHIHQLSLQLDQNLQQLQCEPLHNYYPSILTWQQFCGQLELFGRMVQLHLLESIRQSYGLMTHAY
jgi:hypothetical protein